MSSGLVAMATFAVVGAVTPGPVNVLAIRHGARRPWSVPLLFVLGASASYTLVVWTMGSGTGVLLRHPLMVQISQWAGAAYLLYLAWRIARAPVGATDIAVNTGQAGGWAAFVQGFLTQALNPKAWLVALSGVVLFTLPQPDAQRALWLFCAVSFVACMVGVGTWAALGMSLNRWLDTPMRQRRLHQALAALLCLTVASMLA
ncbi:MAG: lysine transporter LysE [Burkholderiales bacterium RIFCSPLOWO2_12_67_14]|nr:MAG: lysine transporter LysE [Burkholderiales bacterium RIFCSPLOWO2_02_FULL_67_64]OGB38171.1 MAG: lysine transporter LysE [Burkholderiales bacterium RIFCSPHIGHO2_12_FULL_67_38]OGB42402.1 MAG: lysine transporter LysE [Burkholderiales bacterium RIFCSPLOWO2_12_67_14]OGC00455.1 MAG: lysine transporter LysE [Burkholderiales bacterium RIFCSPLOWO2_12_FULL_67_210]